VFSGGEVSYLVYGGGVITVQIEEILKESVLSPGRPGRKKYYTFGGAGLSFGGKAGATLASDWKEFSVPVQATVDDFEGVGSITAFPGASLVVVSLSLGLLLTFKNPYPFSIYLNTSGFGLTSGIGLTIFSFYPGWWEGREPIFTI